MIKFSFISLIIFPMIFILVLRIIKILFQKNHKENLKKEYILRFDQFLFFIVFTIIGLGIFSGLPNYFLENLHHYYRTEIAAYWSYPYISLVEKIWWVIIAPTQIVTVPILILALFGLLKDRKKSFIPLVFLMIPLLNFGIFMHSKGARMFSSLAFPICFLASIGFYEIIKIAPNVIRKKSIFIVGLQFVFFVTFINFSSAVTKK